MNPVQSVILYEWIKNFDNETHIISSKPTKEYNKYNHRNPNETSDDKA